MNFKKAIQKSLSTSKRVYSKSVDIMIDIDIIRSTKKLYVDFMPNPHIPNEDMYKRPINWPIRMSKKELLEATEARCMMSMSPMRFRAKFKNDKSLCFDKIYKTKDWVLTGITNCASRKS